jgi:NTE family protein
MLFHVGALWRLHELGLLREVETISSVSGGSITAGMLAMQFERIQTDPPGTSRCFRQLVAEPLIALAQTTIDVNAALESLVSPKSSGNVLATYYRAGLFGDKMLSDLPARPSFVFQATNLHTGSVWSFSRAWMGDAQVKYTVPTDVTIAEAVAASSSFPPVLSPFVLNGAGRTWGEATPGSSVTKSREWGDLRRPNFSARNLSASASDQTIESIRQKVWLTDGGVADNLAIEGIWYSTRLKLISDGGANVAAVESPPSDWLMQLTRITELIHAQPSQLRYRDLLAGFTESKRYGSKKTDGTYWALGKPLPCHREDQFAVAARADPEVVRRVSATPTRLAAMSEYQARRIVNLGYHIADWGLPYVDVLWASNHRPPFLISEKLPYEQVALWADDKTQSGAGQCPEYRRMGNEFRRPFTQTNDAPAR